MKNVSIILRTAVFCIFFSACTKDHELPGSYPDIQTLPMRPSTLSTTFAIKANALGHKPILEHGIVYTAYFRGAGNHNLEPTVEDNRVIFDTNLMVGTNEFTYLKDFIAGRTFFYYRAYVILSDNSVVYANRLSYTIE